MAILILLEIIIKLNGLYYIEVVSIDCYKFIEGSSFGHYEFYILLKINKYIVLYPNNIIYWLVRYAPNLIYKKYFRNFLILFKIITNIIDIISVTI